MSKGDMQFNVITESTLSSTTASSRTASSRTCLVALLMWCFLDQTTVTETDVIPLLTLMIRVRKAVDACHACVLSWNQSQSWGNADGIWGDRVYIESKREHNLVQLCASKLPCASIGINTTHTDTYTHTLCLCVYKCCKCVCYTCVCHMSWSSGKL